MSFIHTLGKSLPRKEIKKNQQMDICSCSMNVRSRESPLDLNADVES